ncbi:MAG: tRNA pseudouridine(55) synthase TruB, partial [Candidatus Obscuribacterales bacterium]|nr:tRNA pseudouridine(55) synthase TruB [Steroidobacteraceae bacterium]
VKVALSAASGELLRLYGPKRRFLGVGEIRGDGEVHPKRLVASRLNPAT